ncbi:MAG: hypothetical protein AB1810_13680 [Pseudomonadota bacterium]
MKKRNGGLIAGEENRFFYSVDHENDVYGDTLGAGVRFLNARPLKCCYADCRAAILACGWGARWLANFPSIAKQREEMCHEKT